MSNGATEIVKRGGNGGARAEVHQSDNPTVGFVGAIEQYWRLANMLVASGMIPIKKPEAAMAIMLKAHELGIPAMHAFANLHFFDGKLVESAALMVGMAADRCGVTYEVEHWDETRCKLLFRRPGWSQALPSEFTTEDARRAGLLTKDNWKKYPKAMLLARAQSQGVRAIAPDRFAGAYAAEEIGDVVMPIVPDLPAALAPPAGVDELNAALSSEVASGAPLGDNVEQASLV